MEVVVYTRPGDEDSRRIKELLSDVGVAFEEHVCADGKLNGKQMRSLDIGVSQRPLTVVDGAAIPDRNRAPTEQCVGRVGVQPLHPRRLEISAAAMTPRPVSRVASYSRY